MNVCFEGGRQQESDLVLQYALQHLFRMLMASVKYFRYLRSVSEIR